MATELRDLPHPRVGNEGFNGHHIFTDPGPEDRAACGARPRLDNCGDPWTTDPVGDRCDTCGKPVCPACQRIWNLWHDHRIWEGP